MDSTTTQTPVTTPTTATTAVPVAPQAAPAVPAPITAPVAEEPKKAPEVKTLDLPDKTEKKSNSLHPANRPHAFVIMPFGKKKGGDGLLYDFNAIYKQLIKPAL